MYDLNKDPYQMWNIAEGLDASDYYHLNEVF